MCAVCALFDAKYCFIVLTPVIMDVIEKKTEILKVYRIGTTLKYIISFSIVILRNGLKLMLPCR